ncbi:MAG TPA: DUF5522 domain-containing protein [Edaphobacter sp.]|nr:DUF5522 domain-containing protein [Edaphobacter sp.]
MSKPDLSENVPPPPQINGELDPEDFYYEGPYLVFTERFLRKRGYCCNSCCRHCPYK